MAYMLLMSAFKIGDPIEGFIQMIIMILRGIPAACACNGFIGVVILHRPWQLCQTVFEQLLAKCQTLAASQPGTRKKRKFRFKNPLLSLGASVIDLCATMFDWTKFRLTKGAVKLHLLLDHDG